MFCKNITRLAVARERNYILLLLLLILLLLLLVLLVLNSSLSLTFSWFLSIRKKKGFSLKM